MFLKDKFHPSGRDSDFVGSREKTGTFLKPKSRREAGRSMRTKEYEKHLAKEMEHKLFEHVYVTKVFDQYWACTDYYTVKNGKVYLVNNNTFQPSGDKLETLKNDCHCVGEYESGKEYIMQKQEFTHEQLLKRLKLR